MVETKPQWFKNVREAQVDPYSGYMTLIVRTSLGHLCGYVELPKTHFQYGQDYFSISGQYDVHGGLTFGEYMYQPSGREAWLIGFDCAHSSDYVPYLSGLASSSASTGQYRDIQFVRDELTKLCRQLKDADTKAKDGNNVRIKRNAFAAFLRLPKMLLNFFAPTRNKV